MQQDSNPHILSLVEERLTDCRAMHRRIFHSMHIAACVKLFIASFDFFVCCMNHTLHDHTEDARTGNPCTGFLQGTQASDCRPLADNRSRAALAWTSARAASLSLREALSRRYRPALHKADFTWPGSNVR